MNRNNQWNNLKICIMLSNILMIENKIFRTPVKWTMLKNPTKHNNFTQLVQKLSTKILSYKKGWGAYNLTCYIGNFSKLKNKCQFYWCWVISIYLFALQNVVVLVLCAVVCLRVDGMTTEIPEEERGGSTSVIDCAAQMGATDFVTYVFQAGLNDTLTTGGKYYHITHETLSHKFIYLMYSQL